MNETVRFAMTITEGPLFRFAFALMVLAALRHLLLSSWDAMGAYLSDDRANFRLKLRRHALWFLVPAVVWPAARRADRPGEFVYLLVLSVIALIFKLGAVLVPAFMVAHVYLWEHVLGISWPALPPRVADVLALTTMTAGFLLFLGRLYSPLIRATEPAWSFIRPLIVIVPFVTGWLCMHPNLNPLDYYVMRVLHVGSAALVFVLIPFGRVLAFLYSPLSRIVPGAAWRPAPAGVPGVVGAPG